MRFQVTMIDKDEKTFREKMDIKSTRLMINARAGKFS